MYLAGGWLTKYIEGTMPLPNSGPVRTNNPLIKLTNKDQFPQIIYLLVIRSKVCT